MSSLQCPASPVYHTSVEQKLRSQNAARQYKIGSPKLRDLLRQKCKVRVREARRASFDSRRTSPIVGANTLVSKILRQELADLESDLSIQEHIYRELIDEMNLWYAQQLEEEEEYLIDVGDSEVVFCPICQKAALLKTKQEFSCQCGISFNFDGTMESLLHLFKRTIDHHENQCSESLYFFVEQNSHGKQKMLNAMCEVCDYFVSLT